MPSDKKLRIIHTEASPHWGGQEIRIFEEMKWFREQGHEMILVAPDNGTLYQRCKDEDFEVISLYFTKPRALLNILRMIWVIWRKKPNVVATHSSTDSWAGLIAAKVLSVHKRVRYRHISATVKKNILNRWQYSELANLILTTGECIRKPLIINFWLNRNKVLSLPTPVPDMESELSKETAKEQLCEELNVELNSKLIGQISVFRGWKGHLILIDSFVELAIHNVNIHLILIGDGPLFNQIKEHASLTVCSERIHFLGHKEEPWPYYMGLDICVLASLKNEGVPQTLLKAMRANTLVLGTNVGGIPEIVFNHKTGVLVEPNDKKSLMAGLGELLNKSEDHRILLKNANDLSLRYAWRNIGQLTIDSFLTPNTKLLSSSRESVHGFFPERKKNVIILAHHSSWGAAANFREMFSFDNQYSVIEINHDLGSKNEYNFGEGNSGESITIDNISFVENLFNDPDSIVFVFDYLGIKLFEKVCKSLEISPKSLPLNIFWSGNPFIKNRAFCLNWAKKYNVMEYAMLDLLRLANNALPLMQPYDLKKLVASNSNAKSDNIIRICHSPGHKGNNNEKGTKSIQSAINELKIDFKNIEYVLLGGDKWVDNAECLKIKSTCDIFIDKVGKETAGGIGKSGIESICFGIPTISSTHMSNFEGRYSELRVLSADTYDDLINNLRKLISDADYYNKCKSETIVSRDIFCYEKTLSYLEQTMNQ